MSDWWIGLLGGRLVLRESGAGGCSFTTRGPKAIQERKARLARAMLHRLKGTAPASSVLIRGTEMQTCASAWCGWKIQDESLGSHTAPISRHAFRG